MRFLPLVLKNLFRKKIRAILTILSITVAMFLFGILAVIDLAFTAGLEVAGADRLVVISRTSLMVPLVLRHKPQMERIPYVEDVTYASWFGGIYQDERNFFPQFGIEPESYLTMYPEFLIPEDQRAMFLADREGCLVGRKTAERFGWKLGDRIPLRGTIFPGTWEFNLRAIYHGKRPEDDETLFMFHHKLIEERIQFWDGRVGWYVVKVDDPAHAEGVTLAIDEQFANTANETRTQPEEVFIAGWINQIGNIRLLVLTIGSVVLFTLLLVTGNTMAIAVRERTGELAVLKTVGFSDRIVLGLVLVESIVIALAGGVIGIAAAKVFTIFGNPMPGLLPVFHLPASRIAQGFALTMLVGLTAGIIPAVGAMRLKIVDALRRV
jgi:putative ABC transport system permease protein